MTNVHAKVEIIGHQRAIRIFICLCVCLCVCLWWKSIDVYKNVCIYKILLHACFVFIWVGVMCVCVCISLFVLSLLVWEFTLKRDLGKWDRVRVCVGVRLLVVSHVVCEFMGYEWLVRKEKGKRKWRGRKSGCKLRIDAVVVRRDGDKMVWRVWGRVRVMGGGGVRGGM